ncbi:SDR family oxidoreductase [Myxococcota bacterium]|nr:SDR family oxidoreductase [Myxococcota bacterium]
MSYAVITGASSGLGREFARALAKRGFDLGITARRVERLMELKEELTAKYHVDVAVYPCDLTDSLAMEGLIDSPLFDRPLDLFVNNAGMGHRGLFSSLSAKDVHVLLALNVTSHARLLHHVFSGMMQRKEGKIINVASVAGFGPMPWLALYGASKSFVLSLSLALAQEGRSEGVTICALCPGPVDTEFFESAGVTEFHFKKTLIAPETVVKYTLDALDKGRRVAIPRALFRMQRLVHALIPEGLLTRVTAHILKKGL